jgi:hypothetical protein
MLSMELWQTASLAFFAYILFVLSWRGARRGAGRRVLAGSLAGFAVVGLSLVEGQPQILIDLIWPPLVLLIGYWTSGLLFIAPQASQERMLASLDRRLGVAAIGRKLPRVSAELLEAAYLGVYGLIPLALLAHVTFGVAPSPSRFWAVVLITDFVCFGALPWVQTRPPRALEPAEPWISSIRRLNLRVLGSTSIQVNTFPSGHAAEGFVAALLVLDAPLPIVAAMTIAALMVSAGAELGRYHYLADALAGVLVAAVAWTFIGAGG